MAGNSSSKGKKIRYTHGGIAIVYSAFHREIVEGLLAGARHALFSHGTPTSLVYEVEVPGAFEIPLMVQRLAKTKRYGVIITLGAVVKGDTDHYDYVCKECADGIMRVSLDEHIPIVFEVLMALRPEDAISRSHVPNGDEVFDWMENKGYVAGLNALELLYLYGTLKGDFLKKS